MTRPLSFLSLPAGRRVLVALLLCVLCAAPAAGAVSLSRADSLYKAEDYAAAAALYEQAIKQDGPSSVIYYNLGNAYYKDQQIPRAILAYERALLLNPSDRDARFNLELARQKTIDKQTPPAQMFFVTWWQQLSCAATLSAWAIVAIAAFVLLLAALLCYAFSDRLFLRKTGAYGSGLMLLVCLLANLCLLTQWRMSHNHNHAIVLAPTTAVKSSPGENSTDLFLIHEGTRLRILDDSMQEWREVEVEEGKEGWVRTDDIEVI